MIFDEWKYVEYEVYGIKNVVIFLMQQRVKKVCGLVRIFFSETTMIKTAIYIGTTGSLQLKTKMTHNRKE